MLTPKQKNFIHHYIASPSIEIACKKAGIDRRTFYNWMKKEEFKEYLETKQKEVVEEALKRIKLSITKAVDNLIECLNSDDERMRRLTSKDILDYFIKVNELQDIEQRLEKLEKRLSENKGG